MSSGERYINLEDLSSLEDWGRQFTTKLTENDSFVDSFWRFIYAVNWNENWIIAILVFEVCFLFITIATQHNWRIQSFLFLFTLAIVCLSKTVNTFAHQNWRSFATENYFDPQGMFITILVSLPLCIISIIALTLALFNASKLLITVKRLELQHNNKTKHNEKGIGNDDGKNESAENNVNKSVIQKKTD